MKKIQILLTLFVFSFCGSLSAQVNQAEWIWQKADPAGRPSRRARAARPKSSVGAVRDDRRRAHRAGRPGVQGPAAATPALGPRRRRRSSRPSARRTCGGRPDTPSWSMRSGAPRSTPRSPEDHHSGVTGIRQLHTQAPRLPHAAGRLPSAGRAPRSSGPAARASAPRAARSRRSSR